MTTRTGPFDMVARQTLAALWFEAERVVHGGAACLYDRCPHSIDMTDLLDALARVHPPLYEDHAPPALAN